MSSQAIVSRVLFAGVVLAVALDTACPDEKLPPPTLNGRLLFHRYTSYNDYDSRLFLYDFHDRSLTCISESWPIDHAMNAHFAPDGEQIVFMGLPKGKRDSNDWDVFCWKFGSNREPENLTQGNGLRDEDPNFAPDGKSIVFKQAGRIAILDLETKAVHKINVPGEAERSMPVFVSNGRKIVMMEDAGAEGDLYVCDRNGTHRKAVAAEPRLQEYFPVRWGKDRLLYVRWHSADNRNDQIFVHDWKTGTNQPLPFCKEDANYSDPCPIDGRWVFFSSTREGGAGGYDLYLGDSVTGAVHGIAYGTLNTKAEELGASYLPRRSK